MSSELHSYIYIGLDYTLPECQNSIQFHDIFKQDKQNKHHKNKNEIKGVASHDWSLTRGKSGFVKTSIIEMAKYHTSGKIFRSAGGKYANGASNY